MNIKRALLLSSVFLGASLSFQSCDLSSALLSAGGPTKVNFTSTNSDTRQSALSDSSGSSSKPCGSSLAPGESCTLKVQFTPTTSGDRSNSVQIRSNGEVLEEIALTGQGT